MKRLLGLLLVMGMVGCGQKTINRGDTYLRRNNGLLYEARDIDKLVTGLVVELDDHGQKQPETTYKNGKPEEKLTEWRRRDNVQKDNVQKTVEATCKDEDPEGTTTTTRDPAIVAHYTFDKDPGGKVRDDSGHQNDGVNHGAEYVRGPAGTGNVLRFENPQAFVDCGNDPSLDLTEQLTIELWYFAENERLSGGEPGLVGKSMGSFMLASAGCWFYVKTGDVRYDCSTSPPPKEWHHLAATYDGKYLRTYLDGTQRNVVETAGGAINSAGNLYLRYPSIYGGASVPPVICMMDELRVYQRALGGAEVMKHYLDEANAYGHDVAALVRPKVATHVVPATGVPVVEVDFRANVHYLPAKPTVSIEMRGADGKVIGSHIAAIGSALPLVSWTAPEGLPTGRYVFDVTIKDDQGATIGVAVRQAVTIAKPDEALARPFGEAIMLNNFAADLLHLAKARGEVRFTNPRDGWVLIRTTGEPQRMCYFTKGEHAFQMKHSGELLIRAIPELVYTELGYTPNPFVKSYGPYTWDYLERAGVLDSANVVLIRDPKIVDNLKLTQWRQRGGRQLQYYNLSWLLRNVADVTADTAFDAWAGGGMTSEDSYGMMLDELSGHVYAEAYPHFTAALRRIAADSATDGRVFYPYCSRLYESEPSLDFARAVLDAGYRLAEEQYLLEQPTEEEARTYMNEKLRLVMLRYQDHFPAMATQTVMTLGLISLPHETQDVDPGVDFKVYLDMQMNLLANDPAFRGLYGVLWYHGAYADEEYQRWAAKLNQHYCLEGRRERLTDDPYILPHLSNGDFENDAEGWTLEPAKQGSISTARIAGFGWLQGRFQRDVWAGGDATGGGLPEGRGDHVLVMRRADTAPNRISQVLCDLQPRRLYSLRLTTADYDELTRGESVEKDDGVHVSLENVEILPEHSFTETLTNGGGHSNAIFRGDKKLYMNWRRIVFRALGETAQLTISDGGDVTNGFGAVAINGVQVQPYFGGSADE